MNSDQDKSGQGAVWKMCHTASLKEDIGEIYATNDECGWRRRYGGYTVHFIEEGRSVDMLTGFAKPEHAFIRRLGSKWAVRHDLGETVVLSLENVRTLGIPLESEL